MEKQDRLNAQRLNEQLLRSNAERAASWGAEGKRLRRESPDQWEAEVQREMNRLRMRDA